MPRTYSMHGVMGAAERAVRLAHRYLTDAAPGSRVHDVQQDPRFMHRGIDLLWEQPDGNLLGVEVKGDRHGRRGNYFFELVSNVEKNTPGCFLYSEADVLLYVFLERREVHHLPLVETRAWFVPRAKEYAWKSTQTRVGASHYTTVGAVVPVRTVREAVPSVSTRRIEEG